MTWHKLVIFLTGNNTIWHLFHKSILHNHFISLNFSEKAINDAFKYASKLKYEKTKDMEELLDYKQMRLFIRILRMTYCFYKVKLQYFIFMKRKFKTFNSFEGI